MKSELKEISPTQKEIHLEIDALAVKEAYGKVSKKYANRASVPGFRKGYAPLDVVRLRFKEEIKKRSTAECRPPSRNCGNSRAQTSTSYRAASASCRPRDGHGQ